MSDSLSTLKRLQFNDYACVMSISAVGYDYFLTLSREVDYIWGKDWTWGSTIYILVRYAGLCWIITGAFVGSSFVPGPVKVYGFLPTVHNLKDRGYFKGTALYLVMEWAFLVVLAAADIMMILRVYAIWRRSRRVLFTFLLIYMAQTAISIVMVAIYDLPGTYLSVSVVRIEGLSFCNVVSHVPSNLYDFVLMIPRFALGVLLFTLSVVQALKESAEMYSATGLWQPNRYIKLFVKDGTLYFFIKLSYNIVAAVREGIRTDSISVQFFSSVSSMIIYLVLPRFVLSVRELYDRDTRTGVYGIDSGFGVLTQTLAAGHSATMSAIAFAERALEKDRFEDGVAQSPEAIRLNVLGEGVRGRSSEDPEERWDCPP